MQVLKLLWLCKLFFHAITSTFRMIIPHLSTYSDILTRFEFVQNIILSAVICKIIDQT